MDDDATIYTLKHPIVLKRRAAGSDTVSEETVTAVTVRRAKAKDLRLLDKHAGKIAQSLALIGALTGLTSVQIDELDGEDVTGLSEIVSAFFPEPPKTGATSSEA